MSEHDILLHYQNDNHFKKIGEWEKYLKIMIAEAKAE